MEMTTEETIEERKGFLSSSYGTLEKEYSSRTDDEERSWSTHDEPNIEIWGCILPFSRRRLALELSLYLNLIITLTKLIAYVSTWSLSVLAALLDSVLDVVSQLVLNYTEKHSSMQRSSAFYPAGASRLEPIGVLTCAALMGMASFEVLKESFFSLFMESNAYLQDGPSLSSFWSMTTIVIVKMALLWLCNSANRRNNVSSTTSRQSVIQYSDPTLDALALDHWNDLLSNAVAAIALLCALRSPTLWFVDPVGAILISIYIIVSWFMTGKEQIEHLTGKAAPDDFIDELREIAANFDERMDLDVLRAYHFGPKFLVEIEMVMPKETFLFESHDLGMELQYEIEGREEVERYVTWVLCVCARNRVGDTRLSFQRNIFDSLIAILFHFYYWYTENPQMLCAY